jgi:hypothetical protein
MSFKSGFVWMAFGVLMSAPALAEEIIYFTNGSSLPVRGHVVEGEMIKVDLGNDGFMAFPNSVVEKIVQADADVVLRPSLANVIDGSSNRVYATPAQQRDSWALPEEVQTPSPILTDRGGVAVIPVFPNSDHPGRAKMMSSNVLGNAGAGTAGTQGSPGAERLGVGQIIQGDPSQYNPQRKKFVGLQQRKK